MTTTPDLPKDPVAQALDRSLTMLHWIQEHHSSYEILQRSSQARAEREWEHLSDAIQQMVQSFDKLAELLLAGNRLDLTIPMPPGIAHFQRWMGRRRGLWMWSQQELPNLLSRFDHPFSTDWCDQLEGAANDSVTGKVLCVCVAWELAREVTFTADSVHEPSVNALCSLGEWIDDPTEERFESIRRLVFEEGSQVEPQLVVWWALRVATSAVGCKEAAWALQAACDEAMKTGLDFQRIQVIAKRAVMRRCRVSDRD
jgi:hypothetical protein